MRNSAFTLIELLVACALTMLMSLVMLSAFGMVAGTHRQTEERVEAFREARAALQLMSAELQRRVDVGRLVDVSELGITPPPGVRVAPGNSAFGFLARLPEAAQGRDAVSDVCMVGYFLAPSGGGKALYRRLVPSEETFARLKSGGVLVRPGDLDPAGAERVAENVLDFEVALRDAGLARTTAADTAEYLEIRLRVLGSLAAEAAAAAPAEARKRIEDDGAREFTLRWKLP